eukprot:Skav214735  [mRNA]  locus=scaffold3176:57757:65436:- [translate_table: standard]
MTHPLLLDLLLLTESPLDDFFFLCFLAFFFFGLLEELPELLFLLFLCFFLTFLCFSDGLLLSLAASASFSSSLGPPFPAAKASLMARAPA